LLVGQLFCKAEIDWLEAVETRTLPLRHWSEKTR